MSARGAASNGVCATLAWSRSSRWPTSIGPGEAIDELFTGLMVLGKKSTFNKECHADKYCTEDIDAGSSGKSQSTSTISTITFGLGLVGVGAGVYLIVSNKDEKGAATALQARPMLGGGTVGLARSF